LIVAVFAVAALAIGGVMSWFASGHPDGLEWSIARVTGTEEVGHAGHRVHATLASIQERLAFLPDYSFPVSGEKEGGGDASPSPVDLGSSVSGVLGGLFVLILAGILGLLLRARVAKRAAE
jgi:cobalt/nickel transport system permease protein